MLSVEIPGGVGVGVAEGGTGVATSDKADVEADAGGGVADFRRTTQKYISTPVTAHKGEYAYMCKGCLICVRVFPCSFGRRRTVTIIVVLGRIFVGSSVRSGGLDSLTGRDSRDGAEGVVRRINLHGG